MQLRLQAELDEAKVASAERVASLEAEIGHLKREIAKGVVARRSLERETERIRTQAAEVDAGKFEYLEEKLRAKEQQARRHLG